MADRKKPDDLTAAAHWIVAAQGTRQVLPHLEAVAHASQHLDTALAQAIVAARRRGEPWRKLGQVTGVPWQTLYRQYRHATR